VASWSANRLDIVGRSQDNTFLHKAWTGDSWYPSITKWEDFGGDFSSAPAIVSWGTNRLDIFGIDAESGSVKHKYWDSGSNSWAPSGKDWEDLGGGPFVGDLTASSWGENRFDVWAAGEDGQLNHLYWDGYTYKDWEQMGGAFETAPSVVHWDVGKIDIVGLFDGEGGDGHYHSKAYAGDNWYPSLGEWYDKGGDFAGQPALVANKGSSKYALFRIFFPLLTIDLDFIYVLGVGNDALLKLQIWDGSSWQPAGDQFWDLGDTQNPYPSSFNEWAVQLDL
jgi:hypothetical protein